MSGHKIERGKTLAEQAYEALCEQIKTIQPGNNRLPSEEELAREYGVSRAIIREACNKLIAEGYVSKAPGKGMLAHPSAFAMQNRIDKISDLEIRRGRSLRHGLDVSWKRAADDPRDV